MRKLHPRQFPCKKSVCVFRSAITLLAACVLATACSPLWAQANATGAVSGTVTDPAGAVIVAAKVKLTETATGDTRVAQTNEGGRYVATLLPPGLYSLEVTQQGFKTALSSNVQVIVAETTVLNIRMEPGTVTQTTTVSASAVELQTESSELGRVTDSEMIEGLPLVTRNFTQIIGLNPGVSQELQNAADIGRGGGSQEANPAGGSIMSQGATSTDNNFQMNGLTINDMQGSWIYSSGIPAPSPDAIQEFKVQTALFDATSGRNAGANVDVITRAGTNSFHGSAFEFFRNEDLNANDWFAKREGQDRPILRQNQYGLTLGGPVIKDKLTFFGSWQGTRQLNSADPSNHKIAQLPPLTNDRSPAGLGAVFAGSYGYLGPAFGTIAPDGSNISPQALALLEAKLPDGQYVIPTPQSVNACGGCPLDSQGTAYVSSPGYFNEDQWIGDVDFTVSDRNRIALRYFGAVSDVEFSTLYDTEGFPLYQPEHFDVASITDTYTLSPNLINQFIAGFHRSLSNQSYGNAFTFSSIGMSVPAQVNLYPNIWMIDSAFQTGTTSALTFLQEEYQLADSLSWIKGKHQVTFGGSFTYGRDNMSKFDFQGYLLYLTWPDLLLGQSYAPYGVPYSNIYEDYAGFGDLTRDWRYKQGSGYVQDDYVVSPHLTLNLGLRYERIGQLGAANGTGNVDVGALDPNPPATGSYKGFLVSSNYKGIPLPAGVIRGPNTFGYNGDGQNTWNPRFGFAWLLPGEQVVVRGGAGMYHTTTEGQMNLQTSAELPTGSFYVNAGPYNADATNAVPFPNVPDFPTFTAYSPSTSYTMDSVAQDWRPPTTYHYSLGMQMHMKGPVLDITYSGARDLHTIVGSSINQAPLASPSHPIRGITTSTVANIPERVPYLGWTANTMYSFRTAGQAWYNSLQASLTQKLRGSFQYQAAFTWARLLTPVPGFTVGSNEFGPTGDQNALRSHESGYGPDYNIRPLRFVLSAFYALPSPTSNRLLENTLGGWTIATVTVVQDGQQGSIAYNNTYNIYGITSDRASYASGCSASGISTHGSISSRVNNYINKSCLTTPAIVGDDGIGLGFGDTPNGILRYPDEANVDLALSKAAKIKWPGEGANLQFRADFFNALNHPNFAGPNNTYGTSSFGTITAMATNPRVIQLALKFAF